MKRFKAVVAILATIIIFCAGYTFAGGEDEGHGKGKENSPKVINIHPNDHDGDKTNFHPKITIVDKSHDNSDEGRGGKGGEGGKGGAGGAGGAGGKAEATATGGNAQIGDITNDLSNKVSVGDQKNSQNVEIENPREFLGAPIPGSFVSPGIPIDSTDWFITCPAVYRELTAKKVENMRRKTQLTDVIFPWKWRKHVHITPVGDPLPGNPNHISCMRYWPKAFINPGDDVILAVNVDGDAHWNEEAFFGLAADECLRVGSDRFAVMERTNTDGVTSGLSVNAGGAASQVSGNNGATFVGGGQIGTIKTSVEKRIEYRALCMNRGQTDLTNPPVPPVKKVEEREAPIKVSIVNNIPSSPPVCEKPKPERPRCDVVSIRKQIDEKLKETKSCRFYGFNNLGLRRDAADLYRDLYRCTGDAESRHAAIENYEIAARNFIYGKDIKKNRVKADLIIADVYRNWKEMINEGVSK